MFNTPRHRLTPVLSTIIAVTLVGGCGNRAIYENIQANNRQDCATLPESQYEACMAAANESFDDYQRARTEAIRE